MSAFAGVERVTCPKCGYTFSVTSDWRESFPLTECLCGAPLGTPRRPAEGFGRGSGQESDSLGQTDRVTGLRVTEAHKLPEVES